MVNLELGVGKKNRLLKRDLTEKAKKYNIVNMKQAIICFLALAIALAGCGSKPATQTVAPQSVPVPAPVQTAPQPAQKETVFNPGSISQELFENTKRDVQKFVDELNTIIKNKNYTSWKVHLSDEYFRKISNPEFLKTTSEWPILKSQKITLNSPQDYFTYVVVPSRANSKVDDIEFTGTKRVKVITLKTNNKNEKERLLLYELEQTGTAWKIIN